MILEITFTFHLLFRSTQHSAPNTYFLYIPLPHSVNHFTEES